MLYFLGCRQDSRDMDVFIIGILGVYFGLLIVSTIFLIMNQKEQISILLKGSK